MELTFADWVVVVIVYLIVPLTIVLAGCGVLAAFMTKWVREEAWSRPLFVPPPRR